MKKPYYFFRRTFECYDVKFSWAWMNRRQKYTSDNSQDFDGYLNKVKDNAFPVKKY